jgi:hypothetical protein
VPDVAEVATVAAHVIVLAVVSVKIPAINREMSARRPARLPVAIRLLPARDNFMNPTRVDIRVPGIVIMFPTQNK